MLESSRGTAPDFDNEDHRHACGASRAGRSSRGNQAAYTERMRASGFPASDAVPLQRQKSIWLTIPTAQLRKRSFLSCRTTIDSNSRNRLSQNAVLRGITRDSLAHQSRGIHRLFMRVQIGSRHGYCAKALS